MGSSGGGSLGGSTWDTILEGSAYLPGDSAFLPPSVSGRGDFLGGEGLHILRSYHWGTAFLGSYCISGSTVLLPCTISWDTTWEACLPPPACISPAWRRVHFSCLPAWSGYT